MKHAVVYLMFFYLCFSACTSSVEVPADILPDSTMTKILIDISIIDAAHNIGMNTPDLPRFRPELFYEEVMKKHNTNREQVVLSIKFYSTETSMMKKIYDDALMEVSRRQAEATY